MMKIAATSQNATCAHELVASLQDRFVKGLEQLGGEAFTKVEWLRDDGRHGGGQRFGIEDSAMFGRASVNVSQVHYDDELSRKLGSASAISTIVHPQHPLAPSVHIHISWTEMKDGSGYWRMMADLNPSNPNESDKEQFLDALKAASGDLFDEAVAQGDRYFYIPALGRHRGVAHFYLENFNTGNFETDYALASAVGEAAIDTYLDILKNSVEVAEVPIDQELAAQLAYHTLYLLQVLTLDRGTTLGLMVHDQNDVGILGSLPAKVDKNLLQSWVSRMPEPQDRLLVRILKALPDAGVCVVDSEVKQKLADAVRSHYLEYPEALELQASGNSTPPTVENHR
jgi:coproporphyrinogen III oxidase